MHPVHRLVEKLFSRGLPKGISTNIIYLALECSNVYIMFNLADEFLYLVPISFLHKYFSVSSVFQFPEKKTFLSHHKDLLMQISSPASAQHPCHHHNHVTFPCFCTLQIEKVLFFTIREAAMS